MRELKKSDKMQILVIEPNSRLLIPYSYFSQEFTIIRVKTIASGMFKLEKNTFKYVFLSASYTPHEITTFLSTLSIAEQQRIIPVVIVVDWNNPVNFVPGREWFEKIYILTSDSTKKEFHLTMGKT